MKHLYRIVSLNDIYKAQIWHWKKLKWINVSTDYRKERKLAENDIERVVKTFNNHKIVWRGFRKHEDETKTNTEKDKGAGLCQMQRTLCLLWMRA